MAPSLTPARNVVSNGHAGDNPHLDDILDEVSRWELLAQFAGDGDAGMMWGDGGVLYWLTTADDLAARRFDRARFTWQCH